MRLRDAPAHGRAWRGVRAWASRCKRPSRPFTLLPDPPAEFPSVLIAAQMQCHSGRKDIGLTAPRADTHNRIIEISWLIRAH